MVLKSLEPSQLAEVIQVEEEYTEEDEDGNEVTKRRMVDKPVLEQLTIPGCSLEDPDSWIKVQQCLTEWLGFYEYQQVVNLVNGAQSLSPDMLEDNLQSFFQIRDAQKAGASHNSGPSNTSDSGLANDSA
jgi:hypothetical protein